MIYIYMDGHDRMNDVQTAVQIFMPNEKYKPVDSVQDEGITVRSFLNGDRAVAELYENGAPVWLTSRSRRKTDAAEELPDRSCCAPSPRRT